MIENPDQENELLDSLYNYFLNLKASGINYLPKSQQGEEIPQVETAFFRTEKKTEVSEVRIPSEINWEEIDVLDDLFQHITTCTRCELNNHSKLIFKGVGDYDSAVMIILDKLAEESVVSGNILSGKSGEFLKKIFEKFFPPTVSYYLTTSLKCAIIPGELEIMKPEHHCFQLLHREIAILKPRLIITMGKFSYKSLSNSNSSIIKSRGKLFEYNYIPVLPTFDPAFLFLNPLMKRYFWEDLKLINKLFKDRIS